MCGLRITQRRSVLRHLCTARGDALLMPGFAREICVLRLLRFHPQLRNPSNRCGLAHLFLCASF